MTQILRKGNQMTCARLAPMGDNYPMDCNWPLCGCDDNATKVIESLVEGGWLSDQEADARARQNSDLQAANIRLEERARAAEAAAGKAWGLLAGAQILLQNIAATPTLAADFNTRIEAAKKDAHAAHTRAT